MVQTGAKQSVHALVSLAQNPSSNAYEFKDLHMEFKRPGKYRLTYVVDRYSTSVSCGNPVLCGADIAASSCAVASSAPHTLVWRRQRPRILRL